MAELELVHREIEQYLYQVTPKRDAVLKDMEELAERRGFPIVGPLVGRLLHLLAKISGARRILELGSGYGYSAYWFAKALPEGGRVIGTEGSRENIRMAVEYLARGGLADKVEIRHGDALNLIEQEPGPFDLIFNDIDKYQYPEAFRKALPKLRPGGLLVSDNVLWSGRILQRNLDEDSSAIRKYNELIYQTPELFSIIVPLRDGVSVSLKLR
ncbi:MAG: O-methyltransferase [Acidobacteria bacterium]|nr:O-methyltransferase [Acidobacteriota bacterium]